ncbi:MAG: hypothetical protein LUF26_01920 [Firmicutes bacterium]|nr:hypothetical protein [Bacillota bacterium]
MKKKSLLATAAAMVIGVGLLAGCGSDTSKVTPTFMYFYTNADIEVVEPLIEELEDEYGDKVNFTLVNVDENPEALESFSLVSGNTPMLIMTDTNNDISRFEPSCTDKDTLIADIEAAFN